MDLVSVGCRFRCQKKVLCSFGIEPCDVFRSFSLAGIGFECKQSWLMDQDSGEKKQDDDI